MPDKNSMMIVVVILVVVCCCSFFFLLGGGTGLFLWLNNKDNKSSNSDNTGDDTSQSLSTSVDDKIEAPPNSVITKITGAPSIPPFKPSAIGIVPTKSFLGYYSGLLESKWGDGNVDSCRAYADTYNSKNPPDPYVAYAARGAGNTSLPGTCIYWRQNFQNSTNVVKTTLDPNTKERVVMKCMDPDAYPDNQCRLNPLP